MQQDGPAVQLLEELKRRNVFRVALAYVAGAWLLIQVVETLFPIFGLSDSALRNFVLVIAIGFVPAVVFAWVYEMTPEGLKLERDVDRRQSITPQTGKKLDRLIILTLAVAVALFGIDKFILDPSRDARELEEARATGRSEALAESFGDDSIAVLPFRDMSANQDQAYFSEGLAEELLNLLARVPGLRVTARTSAFALERKDVTIPEIGRTLNVAHVLEGSVRKHQDRVRVTAQLIDAMSDTRLWSETFDETLVDIFEIQDSIARQVVEKLRLTLLTEVPAVTKVDPAAYEHYLKGSYLKSRVTPENLRKAAEELEKSVAIDADYAPAWTALAVTYRNQAQYGYRDLDAGTQKARQAITRALALDPSSGLAWARLGVINLTYDWDFSTAATSIDRALQLDPGSVPVVSAAARLSAVLGDYETAIARYRKLLQLEPLSLSSRLNLGWTQLYGGQLADATATLRELIALDPGYPLAHCMLGQVHLLSGDASAALLEMQREPAGEWREFGTALALRIAGKHDEAALATQAFVDQNSKDWAYQAAILKAQSGDFDDAFRWLEQAYESRDSGMVWLLGEPFLRPLHADSRWKPLLEKMRLEPRPQASD